MKSRIGYINIGVRELERSVAFYRDVLGFELLFSEPSFHYARFSVDGFTFAMAAGGDQPQGDKHTGVGLVVEDVDAAYEELKAKGVRFPMAPSKQPWGGYMAMFADPDGNLFYLDKGE